MSEPLGETYATAPGDSLRETMFALGIAETEVANRTGLDIKTINGIIRGKEVISQETAKALELGFQVPAHFWLKMESRYRASLAPVKSQ